MELDVNDLAIGLTTGEIKIIILRKKENQILASDVASFSENADPVEIAKKIFGIKKFLLSIYPEDEVKYIATMLKHYIELYLRPILTRH